MRYSYAVILAFALTLAACGSDPATPMDEEELLARADALVMPKAGLYNASTEMLEFDVAGLPPQQADRMKDMMSGMRGAPQSYCLTQADVEGGFKESLRRLNQKQGESCDFTAFETDGDDVDAAMSCSVPGGGTADIEMDGTVSAEQQDMVMTITTSSSMIPGGKMTMKMRTTAEYSGPCG
ncbi:hypothetical protein HME9302_00682 [Alteripontixanthobacter maritimus]|uniref:DUF3617 domain-containing protein n=2 Tax=Alteripontixanthobacter maritimus TaxID=2161824 RepID=A0A369Q4T1_9SPHN|nr:hypothetical protein HME9302_00682 [Alteripontixanthobacter maritimus]